MAFATVKVFFNSADMPIVRSYLEDNGIKTYLRNEYLNQIAPNYSGAAGGVELQVKEEDYELAKDLLYKGGFSYSNETEKHSEDSVTTFLQKILNKVFSVFNK